MTPRIKWLLLGGLLLIWVTLVLFDTLDEREPQRVPLKYKTGQTSRSRGKGDMTFLAKRNTDSQNQTPLTFTKPRNIFAPLGENQSSKTTKSPNLNNSGGPPTKAASPMSARRPQFAPPSRLSPDELAAQQARRQLQQYRFLGYLTKEGEHQVFLSNGQAIYIVKQGEILEGNVFIHSIHPTEVILSKPIGNRGMTVNATLPLTEEKGSGA